jgi:NAD(P)-dependent dehydrogenase (short-subunit alcohol dehydrogenase family)
MKIVVIGGTRYIRLATIERLRQQGHDVVAASPQRRALTTAAPRDPGHAGRPLREFLANTASLLHHLWLRRHLWLGQLRQRLGRHEFRGQARGGCEDGVADPTPLAGGRASRQGAFLSLRNAGPAG